MTGGELALRLAVELGLTCSRCRSAGSLGCEPLRRRLEPWVTARLEETFMAGVFQRLICNATWPGCVAWTATQPPGAGVTVARPPVTRQAST